MNLNDTYKNIVISMFSYYVFCIDQKVILFFLAYNTFTGGNI